ncbi:MULTISPECIES: hypothetical protein [unclassified Xanthobacter]|uniref:hypothetical protein n=1 Tax=unclassified Xanthobacter TaxID=2623496 RepID=UPI001EDCBFF7|nr:MULTISPECIES: hypothetical protein [unclassified Xanthobacter]
MDDLIARLTQHLDVSPGTARSLVGIVLKFLCHEAPHEALAPLLAAHPWIPEVLAATPEEPAPALSERHFGGVARLMHVADRMMAQGLTMPQVQEAVRDIVAYARESVGDAEIDAVVRAVPGLRQVL